MGIYVDRLPFGASPKRTFEELQFLEFAKKTQLELLYTRDAVSYF